MAPIPVPVAVPAAPANSAAGVAKSPPVVKSAPGKLVFGGAKPAAAAATPAAAPAAETKAEPPKFTPFQGKGNRLK